MLSIITPTKFRPAMFSLLEKYIARQTLQPDLWVVVCDGNRNDYTLTQNQFAIWRKDEGGCSICQNLSAACEVIPEGSKVLIAEDDEHYDKTYIEQMSSALDEFDLMGVAPALFYNLKYKAYSQWFNRNHASLAATGFTSAVLPLFRKLCQEPDPFIDGKIWKQWTGSRDLILNNNLVVSMKDGQGYGAGHIMCGPVDADGSVLREWIGDDAENYAEWFQPHQ